MNIDVLSSGNTILENKVMKDMTSDLGNDMLLLNVVKSTKAYSISSWIWKIWRISFVTKNSWFQLMISMYCLEYLLF
jgi:hypothetical protein